MATILQCGEGITTLDLSQYELQAALTEEIAILDRLTTPPQGSSVTNTRLDVYWSGGSHLIVLGNGFTQGDRTASVTSFSYIDPLGVEVGFFGNLAIDLYVGDFVGGSLTSFSLHTPKVSVDLEGSMQLNNMEDFSGDVSLLSIEVLGVGVTLNGDLYVAEDGSVTGEIAQIRFDWGNGQFTEFQDISLSFDDFSGYETYQELYANMAAGNAALYGSSVNDTFGTGNGNDTIMGYGGIDTVAMDGIVSQYRINQDSGYACATGPEGIYTLESIEYVRFGSSSYTTDVPLWDALTGNPVHLAEQIADLYVAYFDRAPDTEGFDFWFRDIYTGAKDVLAIAEDFSGSDEYQSTYPTSLTNRAFVEQVYLNLFDRSPDQDGWNFWTDHLDEGHLKRATFIVDVIEGAYSPSSGPCDRALIDNKHDVALYYTGEMVTNPLEGYDSAIVDLLNHVTVDGCTVMAAERIINYAFNNPITLTGVMADEALFDSLWLTA